MARRRSAGMRVRRRQGEGRVCFLSVSPSVPPDVCCTCSPLEPMGDAVVVERQLQRSVETRRNNEMHLLAGWTVLRKSSRALILWVTQALNESRTRAGTNCQRNKATPQNFHSHCGNTAACSMKVCLSDDHLKITRVLHSFKSTFDPSPKRKRKTGSPGEDPARLLCVSPFGLKITLRESQWIKLPHSYKRRGRNMGFKGQAWMNMQRGNKMCNSNVPFSTLR